MSATYSLNIDTGTVTANTADLLTDVETEWQAVFGTSLDTDASTPQGTLIQNETSARTSVMKNNSDMANLLNPDQSYALFLSSICSFNGIVPPIDKPTVGVNVDAVNSGTTPIVIPSGNRVQTSNGDYFQIVNDVSVDAGATGEITISSSAEGPIPLPVGSLTIVDGVIGWGSAAVTSSTSITLGTLSLSDSQLRTVRKRMLFKQGLSSTGAIQANVQAVDNVTSIQAVENNTGAAGLVNGITFTLPSAMYVCVSGAGAIADIASALYAAHGAGCPWDYGAAGEGIPVNPPNGVQVVDPYNQKPYYVKYCTPILFDCYVHVTADQGNSKASEIAIQNTVVLWSTGGVSGQQGLADGVDVSSYLISGAIATTFPGIIISECSVCVLAAGSPPPSYPTGYVPYFSMLPYQEAKIKVGNVQVALS
jgi:hypothetical protein